MKKKIDNSYIKVPNSIIGKLKSNHCAIYVYLLYLCTVQKTNRIKIKEDTIAKKLGIKFRETVSRELKSIEKKGFISLDKNYSVFGMQKCNTVTVNGFDPNKDYFLLPTEHIQLSMPGIAIELMCVLYRFSFGNCCAMPSLSQIHEISHIGNASIIKAYKILEEYGVIVKKNYYKRNGSYGNNRYFFVKKFENIIGSEKAFKFFFWLKHKTKVFYELWQCIKDVISGNYDLLDEICAQYIEEQPELNTMPEPVRQLNDEVNRGFIGLCSSIFCHIARKMKSFFRRIGTVI